MLVADERQCPVEDREIEAIQMAIASGSSQPALAVPRSRRAGQDSHRETGRLEGILVNFKGHHRVVLSVSLLQRSVALEVDLAWVVSLEKSRNAQVHRLRADAPVRATS